MYMYTVVVIFCYLFVGKMVEMGYNIADIRESLAESAYDEICATYMLLGSTPDHQSSTGHISSSSLSPVNPIDNSFSHTPSSSSTRGEVAVGYKYSSPSSKSHSSGGGGTPSSHSANKKISAPGVMQNNVSSITLIMYTCTVHCTHMMMI